MRRRAFLGYLALAPLAGTLSRRSVARAAERAAATSRVRPSDPGWPSPAAWDDLRQAVAGNLIEPAPLLEPCATLLPGRACLDTLENLRNPFFLGDQPSGTQVSGWLDAWTPKASAYAVRARGAADVVAAVNFAREHDLRLVVKGGGHSYQGTSNAPDSLLVWTRAMNAVTLHDAFVARGCEGSAAPVPAVTAEAGAMWIDVYHAVTTLGGRYVQGGGCTTVGVAGLVQSGGFGSMSKAFGTAAGGLIEAEIVTADGTVRTVNACSDPDLFWALKGGGGGSWGVVTKVTLRTHDLPDRFGFVGGTIAAKSDAAFRKLIERFLAFYAASLMNPHWGESVKISPDDTLQLSMVSQGLDDQQIEEVWRPFSEWVRGTPELTASDVRARSEPARLWWDVESRMKWGDDDTMLRDPRPGAPPFHAIWAGDHEQASAFLHGYDSVWLPAALLAPGERQHLVAALFAASRFCPVQLHFNKGLAGAPADAIAAARDTATSPAVLDAFALAIVANGGLPLAWLPLYAAWARHDARAVDEAAAALREVVAQPGSYVSESNYFAPDWQSAYWGPNYERLRRVKTKYDPENLLFVHHGVGSEGWSADGFTAPAAGR